MRLTCWDVLLREFKVIIQTGSCVTFTLTPISQDHQHIVQVCDGVSISSPFGDQNCPSFCRRYKSGSFFSQRCKATYISTDIAKLKTFWMFHRDERTSHHVAYYVFSYSFFTNLVCKMLPRFTNWCFPVRKQQVNSWHIPHNLASQPTAIVADKGKDGVYKIWNIECKIPTQTQHQYKL